MGTAHTPPTVKLFMAFLYNPSTSVTPVIEKIDHCFGKQQFSYGPVPFSWTDYYGNEMGTGLRKIFFSYEQDIRREMLPEIKLMTNELEREFADENGMRRVNIDPGYVTRDKVVLATTKDFYHRLYLSNGIFGEVTLHYRRGKFRYFSWTYPDFKAPEVMHFLEKIRAPLVKEQRNCRYPEPDNGTTPSE